MKILDLDLNLEEAQIIFNSVTSKPSIGKRSPQRGIVRHQFMEVIVRLAYTKYYKKNTLGLIYQGVKFILDEYIINSNKCIDNQIFSEQFFYTEQIDLVLKFYQIPLKYVFQQFSKLLVLPGQKPFMSIEELLEITQIIDIHSNDSNFSISDINKIYCISQNQTIDEIYSEKIFQMNYLEFLLAIARICFQIDQNYFLFNNQILENPFYLQYYLAFKIEYFCQQLNRIYEKEPKPKFIYQDKSVFLKKDNKYKFGFYDE